jgi:hypothetical protein
MSVTDIDVNDPCAAYQAVKTAFYRLLAGEAVATVEFEVGTGTRRKVEYHKSSLPELRAEMERLQTACAGCKKARTVRFATSKGL